MHVPVHRRGATAVPARAHHHMSTAVALPVAAALAYGIYTLFILQSNGASGIRAVLLGLLAAVVSGALGLLLVRHQSSMITETRALAYGALFGTAMGVLYSLTGPPVLRAVAVGLILGAAMFVASLYLFRTHRTREPHGLHGGHRVSRDAHLSAGRSEERR
ncbi:hypothetical protein [Streptomyces sp. MST-110588]|uniref:hypothetical protein n=1 Tax=Streptomyces sp. MST-110588 TaxID=2833628 RepID=UPI001F5D8D5F|nr:hypothetical protein [Streptomyces sp. MST-110588]UNO41500.1 hypothetical protein KGS77_20430 [Streptomyces sp. MST-110588]